MTVDSLKSQATYAGLRPGRPVELARWRDSEAELVRGTFIDTTPVYWRLEVNGELHAYPGRYWWLVIL